MQFHVPASPRTPPSCILVCIGPYSHHPVPQLCPQWSCCLPVLRSSAILERSSSAAAPVVSRRPLLSSHCVTERTGALKIERGGKCRRAWQKCEGEEGMPRVGCKTRFAMASASSATVACTIMRSPMARSLPVMNEGLHLLLHLNQCCRAIIQRCMSPKQLLCAVTLKTAVCAALEFRVMKYHVSQFFFLFFSDLIHLTFARPHNILV